MRDAVRGTDQEQVEHDPQADEPGHLHVPPEAAAVLGTDPVKGSHLSLVEGEDYNLDTKKGRLSLVYALIRSLSAAGMPVHPSDLAKAHNDIS